MMYILVKCVDVNERIHVLAALLKMFQSVRHNRPHNTCHQLQLWNRNIVFSIVSNLKIMLNFVIGMIDYTFDLS